MLEKIVQKYIKDIFRFVEGFYARGNSNLGYLRMNEIS